MFYAKYRDINGEEVAKLYDRGEDYARDTFSPLVEPLAFIDFHVKGKNYRERQSSVQTIAVDFQTADIGGLFMSDYSRIGEWFTTQGKRYGLIKEFRENAVC
jgi:hypothetical protein